MKNINLRDIVNTCNGQLICGDEDTICKRIQKDTRLIKDGDIYIGIKGENFDGNTLYEEALENGATACIISGITPKEYNKKAIIKVEDTKKALQELAKYQRQMYDIPVIGITGSVGKTSTKDIIASVMAQKYKVLRTEGNMNNQIGLPLTILKIENHDAIVVEMGMSETGEIRNLTNIAQPTMTVITNIGTSHIGNLGSKENILRAKLEILEGTKKTSPIAINNDDDLLNKWAKTNRGEHRVITYGIKNESDIMAKNIKFSDEESKFTIELNSKQYEITIPVGGTHFIYNALSAICVGLEYGIKIEDIIKGIKEFKLTSGRMEVLKNNNGVMIINDTYNSSYDSVKAAIEYLHNATGKRKIAILGDMLELGEYSKQLHRSIGKDIVDNKIDILLTVGQYSTNIVDKVLELVGEDNIKTYKCNSNKEAIQVAKQELRQGDTVLVKASHGMHFDEIVKGIL